VTEILKHSPPIFKELKNMKTARIYLLWFVVISCIAAYKAADIIIALKQP
jgi:hypothetical protein